MKSFALGLVFVVLVTIVIADNLNSEDTNLDVFNSQNTLYFDKSLASSIIKSLSSTQEPSEENMPSLTVLTWQQLLPVNERKLLNQYKDAQNTSINVNETTDWTNDVSEQIFNSISAAADQNYQDAMVSSETVSGFNGKLVELPGFIVPIDFYDNNSPSLIFIVPYFGACIHFPPPPPNQMVFARLNPNNFKVELERPYLIKGRFAEGLFEDMVGTSAYQIEAVSIQDYDGEPDDARQHSR